MVTLCTVAQVKQAQPVISHSDDDELLALLISAASEAVIAYLDTRAQEVLSLNDAGEIESGATVPAAVTVATVLTARHMYEGPDEMQGRPGGLPPRAEMLLYRLSDPPLAGHSTGEV